MLGSMISKVLMNQDELTFLTTSRDGLNTDLKFDLLTDDLNLFNNTVKPEYIINCIGLIKPKISDGNPNDVFLATSINSIFPYRLYQYAHSIGSRVIQIATDCVFDGALGDYSESSKHNALDIYGKTKSLGEISAHNFINIRASIIGPEIGSAWSLYEWFQKQNIGTELKGFENHYLNGVTTLQFSKICLGIVKAKLIKSGTYHLVPKNKVSKYELLQILNKHFAQNRKKLTSTVVNPPINRTLVSNYPESNELFWNLGGSESPPTIDEMVKELAQFSSM